MSLWSFLAVFLQAVLLEEFVGPEADKLLGGHIVDGRALVFAFLIVDQEKEVLDV